MFAAGQIPNSLADLSPAEIDIVDAKDVRWLDPGDAWICFCTGGGGYGDPLGRDPDRVADDVRRNLCTADEARRLYGVVLDADGGANNDATEAARQHLRQARLEGGRPPAAQSPAGLDFSGQELLKVGNILSVRKTANGAVLGCRDCGHAFGPAGEDPRQFAVVVETPIGDLSPVNLFADGADVVLHQYCCAGCGTLFSTDLHRSGEDPLMPEMHLALDSVDS
jgi:N-methylhydantoinase B